MSTKDPAAQPAADETLTRLVRETVRRELADAMAAVAAQLRQTPSGGAAGAGAPGAGAAVAAAPRGGIDGRTLAILTAAAMAVIGGPVRVRRVTYLNQNTISAWAEMGRYAIQASHNIRRTS